MSTTPKIDRVIDGKRYITEKAITIASDSFKGKWLFRTHNGAYFTVAETIEQYIVKPLTLEEAIPIYYALHTQEVNFEEAFPEAKIEEA
jgi:hypothetical protein